MASVVNRPNGHKWIQVRLDGKRQTIRLGKASSAQAVDFRRRIESLVTCKALQQLPDPRTLEWLVELDEAIYKRLAAVGLVEHRRQARTLDELLNVHLASLDVKEQSKSTFSHTARNLRDFFKPQRDFRSISAGDAKEFRVWLAAYGRNRGKNKGGPLAPATVSRRCRRAREVFAFAIDKDWIIKNPFRKMKGWVETNRERDFYLMLPAAKKLLDAAESELRLLIALVRFQGVRCPSEALPMQWDQINWEQSTILVRSPKTDRYPDGAQRIVPIFEQFWPYLQAAWDRLPERQPLMFPNLQMTNPALSKRLAAACGLAGIPSWPKPWINLRASCETDLIREYRDIYRVAAWLGHSPQVALEHYNRIAKELESAAVGTSAKPKKAKQYPKHA